MHRREVANKWFHCRDRDFEIKGMFWRPTKKETTDWLERKEWDFVQQENKNPQMSDE